MRAANRLTWRDAAYPLTIVAIFVFIRSVAQQGSANFIPVLLEQRGYDSAQYGVVTGLYWIASGVFGVFYYRSANRNTLDKFFPREGAV